MLKKQVAIACLLLSPAAIAQQAASPESPRLEAVRFSLPLASSSSADEPSNADGVIRPTSSPRPVIQLQRTRPFHSLALGVTASTLGAGLELATPLSRSFNLRSGLNYFSFDYGFTVDGLRYNSRLHLKSIASTVDWFPWHHGFHISPGVLYAKNSMAAATYVGPGQRFTLGDQDFIDSVNDPVSGTASLIFPHQVAPLLTIGFGNLLPRSGRHISVPFEIGAAYTGSPHVDVNLNGTACTTDGCFTFASNQDAQNSLHQEVHDINEDLKRIPVFPVLSLGFAYKF